MIREPAEVIVDENGRVELPTGLLAEAGLGCGSHLLAYSAGDGRIMLRCADDAIIDLLGDGNL
ncbi:hypothetical protein ACWGSE_15260 [Streptomyces diastaticus]|uniref:hypothetical protein n=1 Tax=Streptomyces diastaticus TaxID=1956 RepID=UPI0033E3EFBC